MKKKTYNQLLSDNRWKALSVKLRRERPYCELCRKPDTDVTTQVHHGFYNRDLKPWEYPEESLWVLCEECHAAMDKVRREMAVLFGHLHPAKAAMAVNMIRAVIQVPIDQPFRVRLEKIARPDQIVTAKSVPRSSGSSLRQP